MRINIFCFLMITFLFSCKNESKDKIDFTVKETKKNKSQLKIETPQLFEIDSSGVLLMPLKIGETIDESFGSSYDSRKEDYYWNIIFYNSNTSAKHLLSESKMLISNYTNDYGSSSGGSNNTIAINSSKKHLFYNIRVFDGNSNGKLDLSDPEYLFISTRTGLNLQQLSPKNTHLVSWNYIESSNKVLMNVQNDANADKIWDDKDQLITYEYDLNTNISKLVFDDKYKENLKENFTKNWLK